MADAWFHAVAGYSPLNFGPLFLWTCTSLLMCGTCLFARRRWVGGLLAGPSGYVSVSVYWVASAIVFSWTADRILVIFFTSVLGSMPDWELMFERRTIIGACIEMSSIVLSCGCITTFVAARAVREENQGR